MMKRVAINAVVLTDEIGGLGVYIKKLIDYLAAHKPDFQPVIFISEDYYKTRPDFQEKDFFYPVKLTPFNPVKRILHESFLWPRLLKKVKADLFYSPISYIPFGVNIPAIITIHDLRSFHFKEFYSFTRLHYLQYMIRKSAKKSKRILTISEFTGNDIHTTLGIPLKKIKVIYEGADTERFNRVYSRDEKEHIRVKYKLPERYILSVGHLEPRKNYIRLLEAFSKLKNEFGIQESLVIVGRENWLFKGIYDTINRLKLNNSVIFTKFIEDNDLPALYQMADIFVTASTFEGFGFTPLESMAAGTPAAVSNSTSLPEVAGDAALYFDPYNVDDITLKLYTLLTNKTLQEDLLKKGYQNIQRFNWDNCFEQVMREISQF